MRLKQLAAALGITWSGDDIAITGVSTDSRQLQQGDLFVALVGDRHDGHDHIVELEGKAVAAVVSKPVQTELATLQVADTLEGLTQLARYWRHEFVVPVVAITGSCGKTTTRSLVAAVLATTGSVLASEKSFNNHIGVPLTLLRLRPEHDFAVLEVGTSSPGEIVARSELIQPNIAVITNAQSAHLAGLGSLEGIVAEKGDLLCGLAEYGVAILNADDPHCDIWRDRVVDSQRVITFGLSDQADISASDISYDEHGCSSFVLKLPQEQVAVNLQLMGEHNICNALAAAAVGHTLGVAAQQIAQGLSQGQTEPGRLRCLAGLHGARVIDDSYNANPSSVAAALQVLAKQPEEQKILVFADMLELGDASQLCHEAVGEQARNLGLTAVFAYGEQSVASAKSFGAAGRHFVDQQSLITALQDKMDGQTVLLVKGSNSMQMQQVVQALINKGD